MYWVRESPEPGRQAKGRGWNGWEGREWPAVCVPGYDHQRAVWEFLGDGCLPCRLDHLAEGTGPTKEEAGPFSSPPRRKVV